MSTTTTTKFTKKVDFTAIIEILATAQENSLVDSATATRLIDRMNHEIELLAKKNSSERKPTKNQIANQGLATQILDVMEDNTFYTISQILKALDNESLNQSKISAVVRGMLIVTKDGTVNPNGTIERIMEKGVALFRKVETNTDTEEEEEG
jgi:hypothetical protein